ncbi:hypothetical protein ACEZDB_36065 [Streptacidiphilus sp. N1-3]|uniref:Lsr2 protein n=1 Tax=Streptacidiphilus alkalitolerans TaxID=3342712 RepID=A0ABV6XDP9_9ACTN
MNAATTDQGPTMGDSTWNGSAGQAGTDFQGDDDRRRAAALQRLERAGATIHAHGDIVPTSVLEQAADLAEHPADRSADDPHTQALLDTEAHGRRAPVPVPSLWQRWRSRPRKRLSWEEAARRADQDLSGR